MVSRAFPRVACGGLLLAAAFSCGTPTPEEPDYVRVVVDIDDKLQATGDIDHFALEVTRGSKVVDSKNYDVSVLGKLPDSLIIYNSSPNNDSPEKQLESVPIMQVTLTAYDKDGNVKLINALEYRFNRGQLQIALPMCRDCLMNLQCANEGKKCKRGACVDKHELSTAKDEGTLIDALAECGL